VEDSVRTTNVPPSSSVVFGFGLVLTVLLVFAILGLTSSSGYDIWGGALIGPILVLASLPALRRQANREGDRRLFWLLVIVLVLKLLGAVARHYVAFDVYGGSADAARYDEVGTGLAFQFHNGNFHIPPDISGTQFIEFVTGIVYSIIGSTKLGGFVFFSWLGFWGLFLMYRAYVLAVPQGNRRSYFRLLFFLPSLVFWPSSIGKESWMIFAIGIAAFGAARLLSNNRPLRGLFTVAIGLWAISMVRPHIGGMVGLGLAGAYVFRRPSPNLRQLAPMVKLAGVASLIALSSLLVTNTEKFLNDSGVDTSGSLADTLFATSLRTSTGGSEFVPSIAYAPAALPFAVLTVLFRPFPFEATNPQQLFAALEGTFLLLLCLARLPSIWRGLKSVRQQPYVAMAIVYGLIFIVAFSSFSNFGLLARERSQLLPFILVFLTFHKVKKPVEENVASNVELAHRW
jgi:hypothetical protein